MPPLPSVGEGWGEGWPPYDTYVAQALVAVLTFARTRNFMVVEVPKLWGTVAAMDEVVVVLP